MSAAGPAVSAMRQTMDGQAGALARILGDDEPVMAVAERLRDRRVLAIGTGTSWHAASQAAALLRTRAWGWRPGRLAGPPAVPESLPGDLVVRDSGHRDAG